MPSVRDKRHAEKIIAHPQAEDRRRRTMKNRNSNRITTGNKSVPPIVSSYDASYEHSLEHYVAVKKMVDKPDLGGAAVSGIYQDFGSVDHAVDARETGARQTGAGHAVGRSARTRR